MMTRPIAAMLLLGATVTVMSAWLGLEQWGPLFALWTAGGAHVAWILTREPKSATPTGAEARPTTEERPAA